MNCYVEFKNSAGKVEHVVEVSKHPNDTYDDIIRKGAIALLGRYNTEIVSRETAVKDSKTSNIHITDMEGEIIK